MSVKLLQLGGDEPSFAINACPAPVWISHRISIWAVAGLAEVGYSDAAEWLPGFQVAVITWRRGTMARAGSRVLGAVLARVRNRLVLAWRNW
jgi:hypothetical protein